MAPYRGTEWEYVEQPTPDGANCGKLKCKLCNKKFRARASRIRGHFLKIVGRGVASYEAEDSKLKPGGSLEQLKSKARRRVCIKHRSINWTRNLLPLLLRSSRRERTVKRSAGPIRTQNRG